MVRSNDSTITVVPATQGLLFDGSFKPTDRPHGDYGGGGAWTGFGDVWNAWYCIPQPDAFTIVPAPGGRPGYAAKVKAGPSPAYDCGGNQHIQASVYMDGSSHNGIALPGIPNPNRDVWYGWSQMLDPSFVLTGGWGLFSFSISSYYYGTIPNGNNRGLNIQFNGTEGSTSPQCVLCCNCASIGYKNLNTVHGIGVWYDWMYHIKYTRDSTGFIEVYLRKPADADYRNILTWTNIQTEYPFVTPETNFFLPRIGIYRQSHPSITQIVYFYNPKIGTTRGSVEYRR